MRKSINNSSDSESDGGSVERQKHGGKRSTSRDWQTAGRGNSSSIPIKLDSSAGINFPLGTSPARMLGTSPHISLGTSPWSSRILVPGTTQFSDTRHVHDIRSAAESMLSSSPQLPRLSRGGSDGSSSEGGSREGSSRSVVVAGNPYEKGGNMETVSRVVDLRDKDRPMLYGAEVGRSRKAMDVEKSPDPHEPHISFWHPTRFFYKTMVLFLQCMLTYGSCYCYDIPGALKSSFFHRFPNLTQLEYNLMYSLYSWPNTVQVFFGGYIIDKYVGVRWGCVICALLGTFGQLLVTIGVQTESLSTVLAGRFIFGMGGETLYVAQSAYVAKWYKGAELATAFGICLSFSRVGSAVNFDLSPLLASMDGPLGGFVAAEWWGVGMTLVSLVCCLILNVMDNHADKVKVEEKELQRDRRDSIVSDDDEPAEEVSLSDVWTFGTDVWILFLICISFYASVFVFLQNGVQFIRQRYDVSEQNAAFLMSLPYTISALACPVFGFLVDQTGRALVWVFMSTSMLASLHFCFAYNKDFPAWMGLSMLGISYSVCAAALWPCVAIVVELHKLGTAYGLMTAFQNLGLAVFPLLIADLLPEDEANFSKDEFYILYGPVISVFAVCGAVGAALTLVLWLLDLRNGGWLNASAAALLERDEQEEREEKEALEAKRRAGEETETAALLPDVHVHVSHQRGRYLSKLGIRPAMSLHGGPRVINPKPYVLSPAAFHRHISSPI